MSYKITFTDPGKDASGFFITVTDNTLFNGAGTGGLTLVGRNYPGFGQYIAENFIHLLENSANSAQPDNPIEGQLWFDTSDPNAKKLKINDGTANAAKWYPVGGIHQQGNQPSNTQIGDIWVDTSNNQLKIFNGSDFTLIGPNYSSSLKTGSYATTSTDILGQSHNIVINYVNDNAVEIISQDSFTPNQVIDGFGSISAGVNLTGKNLGTSVSPVYANFNGVAHEASNLKQTIPAVQTVSANNFVRNDINQNVSGIFSINNDGGLRVGLDPTFILQRNDQYNATFLNSFDGAGTGGGRFTFRILKNNLVNDVVVIKTTGVVVSANDATEAALTVNGKLTVNQNAVFKTDVFTTGSIYVSNNVYVGSTLTCKYEQILVGPLTIGDVANTSPTALIPFNDGYYNIGSGTKKWKNVYAEQFIGNLAGTATIATKLIGTSTFSLSGDVTNPTNGWARFNGTPGTYNQVTTLTSRAIWGKASTSTTSINDSILLYRPQTLPDTTGNGALLKQTKADFLQDLYSVALFAGAIVPFAQDTVPSGWVKCDGATYDGSPGTPYHTLFVKIGQKFGGSGSQFRVPDLTPGLASGLIYISYYIKT